MIEEIDGFIPAMVRIGTHMADLRYFRVLPRVGESVEHVDGADLRHGTLSYRVVDIWHDAWHPTDAEDLNGCPTIILDDPQHPRAGEGEVLRLHPDDIVLLAQRIAEELKSN
jgi:hypothetical protein